MNIKEHIEAGHYPKDDKGRALVPMQAKGGEWVGLIYATDYPGKWPILGRSLKHNESDRAETPMMWDADGVGTGGCHSDWYLLPPPPRKVKVERWLIERLNGDPLAIHTSRLSAEKDASTMGTMLRIVPLTGEYDESWS